MDKVQLTPDMIQGFLGSILQKQFDSPVKSADVHREWWELCCSPDKFVAIAAPRGHAKSTAITLAFTLSAVLFRNAEYVILVSDTETQASLFLGNIKAQLLENEDLIRLFQLKKNDKGNVEFIKDSESDIIVEFEDGGRFRITAKGAEQKLRGMLWAGKRPDLIICDDMENDELVMNKERREKMRRWFYGALLPCRSDKGKVRVVGTILHMDSLLERLMPEFQLQTGHKRKFLIEEELRTYTDYRLPWKSIKYRAHNTDFTLLLWPEKKSKEEFQQIRAEYTAQGMPDIYSQEYLNVPLDESVSYFKRSDFLPMRKEDHHKLFKYYIAVDLAVSEKQRSDYTVFVIGAVDEDKRLHVVNVIRDRLDGREIVDAVLALQRAYKPEAIGMEEMMISKSIGPFLNEEMLKQNTYPNLVKLKPTQDKLSRARSIQARCRAGTVRFDREKDWYMTFEDECLKFPRDRHDDQVDAFAYLGLMLDSMLEAPTVSEYEREMWEEEVAENNAFEANLGRSPMTGY